MNRRSFFVNWTHPYTYKNPFNPTLGSQKRGSETPKNDFWILGTAFLEKGFPGVYFLIW